MGWCNTRKWVFAFLHAFWVFMLNANVWVLYFGEFVAFLLFLCFPCCFCDFSVVFMVFLLFCVFLFLSFGLRCVFLDFCGFLLV